MTLKSEILVKTGFKKFIFYLKNLFLTHLIKYLLFRVIRGYLAHFPVWGLLLKKIKKIFEKKRKFGNTFICKLNCKFQKIKLTFPVKPKVGKCKCQFKIITRFVTNFI